MSGEKRTIFIGDVHGCYDELMLLLKKVKFKEESDRLIFLGDLINKGPYSKEVVDFVIDGDYESIMGNHELGFLMALENPNDFNKGFKKFYKELGKNKEEVIEWIKARPLFIEEDDFICVHGGLAPNVTLQDQEPRVMTRIRTWGSEDDLNDPDNPPWHKFYKGDKTVIYGHWATQGYHKTKNTICLDSGCVWGGSLTGLIWPEQRAVHIPALEQYKEP